MLTTIHITVRDRVPIITAGEDVISHNSDYVAKFEFDEEWQDKIKTAYFVCEDGSYQAVVMDGNSCDVPMMAGEHRRIFVGVQEGTSVKPGKLKTTRPCCLKVKDSIADYLGQPIPDPTPDVYEQIIAMLNNLTSPTWESVQNKPFSTLGGGLEVDENGVLSAEGGGGGSSVFYIKVTATNDGSGQTTYSADKTAAEIYEALNAKAAMYAFTEPYKGSKTFLPLLLTEVIDGNTRLRFDTPNAGIVIVLTPNDGVPTIAGIEYYEKADYEKFTKSVNSDGSVAVFAYPGTMEALSNNGVVLLYDAIDRKEYRISKIDSSDDTGNITVLCFDDISGKKVRKVTIDYSTTPATLTYSEEPLSTSVNITYDEKTGNLQIGG